MQKLRKMFGSKKSPYILSLIQVIQSQRKSTFVQWAMDYAESRLVPIYLKYDPFDTRPQSALAAAREWQKGNATFVQVKDIILSSCHKAAREASQAPAAQAAARAIGQAAATIHVVSHGVGIALYGAAAIGYDRYGLNQSLEFYDNIAAAVCADMIKELNALE